jgi:hypothetical protein
MRRSLLFTIVLAALAVPGAARAHLMPEGQGSTRIVGNRAYTLLSISARTLLAFDDDRDGLLSRDEIARHGPAIESMLSRRVRLLVDSVPGRIVWQTLSIEHSDTPDAPMPAITLVRISEWDRAPTRLRVATDLFDANGPPQIEFRAILGERTETDTLTARRRDVVFFAPKPRFRVAKADVAIGLAALTVAATWAFFRPRRPLAVAAASRSR